MEPAVLIQQMEQHAEAVRSLVQSVSDEQARWKPDAESWSILEVLCHLYDEEREDFRVRLDYVLHRPGEAWPPIDPRGWVSQRDYNHRASAQTLEGFLAERSRSLDWLRSLGAAEWQAACPTPWGQITAGELFAAWVAHDLLHLRQLVELHWAYLQQLAQPYQTLYAGEW